MRGTAAVLAPEGLQLFRHLLEALRGGDAEARGKRNGSEAIEKRRTREPPRGGGSGDAENAPRVAREASSGGCVRLPGRDVSVSAPDAPGDPVGRETRDEASRVQIARKEKEKTRGDRGSSDARAPSRASAASAAVPRRSRARRAPRGGPPLFPKWARAERPRAPPPPATPSRASAPPRAPSSSRPPPWPSPRASAPRAASCASRTPGATSGTAA